MTKTTSTLTTTDRGFRTQADAVREARTAVWGDVPFAKRAMFKCTQWVTRFQAADLVFAAKVNGDLVVFEFDNYGRLDNVQPGGTGKPLVIKRGAR